MTNKQLTNTELAIMELLWASKPMTARQIREELYPDTHTKQHGTVQKLLQRMLDKGAIAKDVDQPIHLFSATSSKQDYAAAQLESLTDKLTDGSIAPLLTHLIDKNRISKDEIQKLREVLDLPQNLQDKG